MGELEVRIIHDVILTFDNEDFINDRSVKALHRILVLLAKYDFKALFFITGHMAEKLKNFPETLGLLLDHEIGYHSSSHSVRPTIFEYTDVKNYQEAYLTSIKREEAHINPLTGEIEREGGIRFLKDLFPNKSIVSFRAPGCCWSPPHLEALTKLGIQFDFSTVISQRAVYFKGISFYPSSVCAIEQILFDRLFNIKFLRSALKNKITVLTSHPNLFVNQRSWDYIYHRGNPEKLLKVPPKPRQEIQSKFLKFESSLKLIALLRRMKLIEVTPYLSESQIDLTITRKGILESYRASVNWPKRYFDYEPIFLLSHFFDYFNVSKINL